MDEARPQAEADDSIGLSLVIVSAPPESMDAVLAFAAALPATLPYPVILAHRLDPVHARELESTLREQSPVPVVPITERTAIEVGHLYLAPSDRHLEITGEAGEAVAEPVQDASPSVDRLIASAARVMTDNLIGVMLTGRGSDGIGAAQAIKAYGGTVILQDPASSPFTGLTELLPAASVDVVAELEAIVPLIGDLLTGDYPLARMGEAQELRLFLERVRSRTGLDFTPYKRPTIERRLRRRMAAVGAPSLAAYWRHIDRNPEELQSLVSAFLIKVTDFFRDVDLYDHLRTIVLPRLIEDARTSGSEIRIWSAGCATGEEPYSLAILLAELLDEAGESVPVRILATDIAADAIDYARRGIYPPSALALVPPELVQRYFRRLDGAFEISKNVRAMVVFGEHDLGHRAPFPRIDLILCRNVLIYFASDLQRRVLQRFAFSLRPDGLLALGKAESVSPLPEYFVLEQPRLKLFRRNAATAPVLADRGYDHSRLAGTAPPILKRHVRRLAPATFPAIAGQTANERSTGILDRLATGVIVVDRSYDIRAINVAARRMLGIRSAGLGEDLVHQVAPDLGVKLREAINAAFAGESGSATLHLPPDVAHENGLDISIDCSAIPSSDLATSPVHVQIEICDISEFARQAREFAERTAQLDSEHARAQALAAEAAKAVRELQAANDAMATEVGRVRAENEQLQLAHEEVQASAEEIETLHEEQQAANEELETLNEEMQATVEELHTANSELQARTEQLEELTAQLEERSRESDEWFRAVVEEARDYAIFTTDTRSRVEFWSPGAESVFGWSADEIVGESIEITFTPDDRAAGVPEQEFTTARDTGYAPDVRWHMRRDGTRVFIDGSSRARRSNTGRFAGVLKIGQDLTERRREDEARSEAEERYRQELEARVQEATADLRRLSRQLITVQEEERRRLALELHDEIGQMLTGLGLQLGSRATLTDSDLDDARRAIQELTEQVRQMSMDLRPPALDRYGLMPSITWLLERFQHRTGITVELVQAGAEGRFPATVEITAYRIVQESLTNIARHARTPEASINLVADAQSLVVTIRDEGIGFLPDAVRQGSGLGGMRERVALIGGTFTIESRPDAGTTITATLPIAPDLPVPADAGPNPGSGSED